MFSGAEISKKEPHLALIMSLCLCKGFSHMNVELVWELTLRAALCHYRFRWLSPAAIRGAPDSLRMMHERFLTRHKVFKLTFKEAGTTLGVSLSRLLGPQQLSCQ